MTQFFSFVATGPARDPARTMVMLDRGLTALGARIDSDLHPVVFDSQRGVFDVPPDRPGIDFDKFYDNMLPTLNWAGAYVAYQVEGATFHFLVGRVNNDWADIFTEIDFKALTRLFQAGKIGTYYRALAAAARAGRATTGFGRIELPFRPASRDQALAAIFSDPDHPGAPCSLGLASREIYSEKELERKAGGRFIISEAPNGFWILEERDWRRAMTALPW
ncbi:MAG: hypothetical protein V1816_19695 [Pseudomonadota bacterium]